MLIISQNLVNYGLPLPENVIFRINLAWVSSLGELKTLLRKHRKFPILLDLPTRRIKPPYNNYSIEEIISVIHSYPNIEYFAVSNVEQANDLVEYIKLIPEYVFIVPKIESSKGVFNIAEISAKIPNKQKIIMLDHDDLFSSLVNSKESTSTFKELVNRLIDYCNENNIKLLRTRGVIFSDEEKRIT